MVDIDQYISEALSNSSEDDAFVYDGMVLPIYGYMPDFGEDEPSEYIVYTYYDIPQLYADDTEQALEYTVSLSIFTQSANPKLERAVKSRMKSYGFTYQGSTSRDVTTTYPGKYRKNQDYKIAFNEEE